MTNDILLGDSKVIICGDAIEEMKKLPDSCVDLIITSPPYNADKEYETRLAIEEYRQFAAAWVAEIPRILKPFGSFWLNVGFIKIPEVVNQTLPLTYLYHPLVKLPLIQEIVWGYPSGLAYKRRFAHRTQYWMWFAKDPENVTFNLDDIRDMSFNVGKDPTSSGRNNPLGKNPTDYWYFNHVISGTEEKTSHPCPFPEMMIDRIVRACSNSGNIVLDPFAGSLTVAVVAQRLGRRYVAIERHRPYIDDGMQRLEALKEEIKL